MSIFSLIFKQKGKAPSLFIPAFSPEKIIFVSLKYFLLDYFLCLSRHMYSFVCFCFYKDRIILFVLFFKFLSPPPPFKMFWKLICMFRSNLTCPFQLPCSILWY